MELKEARIDQKHQKTEKRCLLTKKQKKVPYMTKKGFKFRKSNSLHHNQIFKLRKESLHREKNKSFDIENYINGQAKPKKAKNNLKYFLQPSLKTKNRTEKNNTFNFFKVNCSSNKTENRNNLKQIHKLRDLKSKLKMFMKGIKKNSFNGNKTIAKNVYALILEDLSKVLNKSKETQKILFGRRKTLNKNSLDLGTSDGNIKLKREKLYLNLQKQYLKTKFKAKKTKKKDKLIETRVEPDELDFFNTMNAFTKNILKTSENHVDFTELYSYLKERHPSMPFLDKECYKLIQLYAENNQNRIIFSSLNQSFNTKGPSLKAFVRKIFQNIMETNELDSKLFESANIDLNIFNKLNNELNCTMLKTERNFILKQKDNGIKEGRAHHKDFSIDLQGLSKAVPDDVTPKGFHQEFTSLANEFSESWRQQLERERKMRN